MNQQEPLKAEGRAAACNGKHPQPVEVSGTGWVCPTCSTKVCGAQLRGKPGRRCRVDKLMRNGRCKLHGGKTPRGAAHPRWKGGDRWARALPQNRLGKEFREAFNDPQLFQLRADMALVDALLTSYTKGLKDTGKPLSEAQERRVVNLVDQRRKLAESEARRLRDLGLMVAREQHLALANTCIALFKEFVTDVKALREIGRRINQLLLPVGPTEEPSE